MAVTATHLTTASSGTSGTSVATASISPTANRLVLATVRVSGPNPVTTPTCTGAGMTWVEVAHKLTAAGTGLICMFRAMSASPGSGALTFDFAGQTETQFHWSVVEFGNVDTSGTNGSGAVVQNATNEATGTQTGITVTLSAFASANNATFGVGAKSTTSVMTHGTGFTELGQDDNNLKSIESQWRNDNSTSIAWTWASESSTSEAIAIEIKFASSIPNKVVGTIQGPNQATMRASNY